MTRLKLIFFDVALSILVFLLFAGLTIVIGTAFGEELGIEPTFHVPTGIYAPVHKVTPKTDQHSHTCPKCGTTWVHNNNSFGNAPSHKCPNCGTMQWAQDAPMKTVVKTPNCPGGNCPLQLRRKR